MPSIFKVDSILNEQVSFTVMQGCSPELNEFQHFSVQGHPPTGPTPPGQLDTTVPITSTTPSWLGQIPQCVIIRGITLKTAIPNVCVEEGLRLVSRIHSTQTDQGLLTPSRGDLSTKTRSSGTTANFNTESEGPLTIHSLSQ